jgi:hypothetical protein
MGKGLLKLVNFSKIPGPHILVIYILNVGA